MSAAHRELGEGWPEAFKKTWVVRTGDASSQIISLGHEDKSHGFFSLDTKPPGTSHLSPNKPPPSTCTSAMPQLRETKMWKKLNISLQSLLLGVIHSKNFSFSPLSPTSRENLDNEGSAGPSGNAGIASGGSLIEKYQHGREFLTKGNSKPETW